MEGTLGGRDVCVESAALGHVGFIPDGNRRYARSMRIGAREAYFQAADKALEAVAWCRAARVAHVSAFGVSQENIARRSHEELCWLHAALLYFCERVARLPDTGLHLFGDAPALSREVPERDQLIRLQRDAESPGSLVVHVGVNYSGRAELDAVLHAVRQRGIEQVDGSPDRLLLSADVPAVDLVIRTGGHRRLSGFLPMQTAYAELWFTSTLWPDLTRDEFESALSWYARQERHFGE
jgi:undecaprenyl diphosphate synthase